MKRRRRGSAAAEPPGGANVSAGMAGCVAIAELFPVGTDTSWMCTPECVAGALRHLVDTPPQLLQYERRSAAVDAETAAIWECAGVRRLASRRGNTRRISRNDEPGAPPDEKRMRCGRRNSRRSLLSRRFGWGMIARQPRAITPA
jgi:hypothetical protein